MSLAWTILVFAGLTLLVGYCRRFPARPVSRMLRFRFLPTSDISGAPPDQARLSWGPYAISAGFFLFVWLAGSYFAFTPSSPVFENPVLMALAFGSLLLALTFLVASVWLFIRSRQGPLARNDRSAGTNGR